MLPDDVSPKDLLPSARNELKTLTAENAERVARHMAMAARAIDDDPALAHEHASAAMRHAGRVAVVRETLAITAYATGDFGLALRELRTVRRISGRNDHIAMIVDSERGVGRPEKALEEGRAADRTTLEVAQRAELAIAMSGARLDLGQAELALHELDIPEADPDRAFEWSPGLFAARAAVLEELGREDEASEWSRRARIAGEAIAARFAEDDTVEIYEIDAPRTDLDRAGWDDAVTEHAEDASGPSPEVVTDEESIGAHSANEAAVDGDRADESSLDGHSPDEHSVDENIVDEGSVSGGSVHENPVSETVVDEDRADEHSVDTNPVAEHTVDARSVDESAVDDRVGEDGAADGRPVDDDAAANRSAEKSAELKSDTVTPAPAEQATTTAPTSETVSVEGIADDASFDPGEGELSIEDEVTEILAAAGIIDDTEAPHADDAEATDADAADGADATNDGTDKTDETDDETAGASGKAAAGTDEEEDRPDGALF